MDIILPFILNTVSSLIIIILMLSSATCFIALLLMGLSVLTTPQDMIPHDYHGVGRLFVNSLTVLLYTLFCYTLIIHFQASLDPLN